jgi:hypothetical protein
MRLAMLGIAATLLTPMALRSQVKLEVTPYFASYYATNHTTYRSADENERQGAGPGIGLLAAYHFNPIVGVQASATHVWSGIVPRQPQAAGTINLLTSLPGALTFAAARVTLRPRRSNYYVAVGPGIVKRSGEAWKIPGYELTNYTGSAAFGIRARITPEWEFHIGLDANLYMFDPDGSDPTIGAYYQKRLQRDVMVTIGVPFAVLGR